jgi:broad specificity phosphatase PhoE
MLSVILIRPGATDYDEQGRIQGTLDVPLNEQGGVEVARLSEELRDRGIEAIYHSPSEPAHQTAEALAKALGVKLKKLENMQNLNHGLWQGMRIDDLKHKHPKVYRQWMEQPECVCPPEGETLESATARVQAALRKVVKKHREGIIGLVVPEPLARVVRSKLTHSEVGSLWTAPEESSRWEVIDVEPQTVIKDLDGDSS